MNNPYNAIDTDAIIPERIKNNYASYKQLKEREKIYRQYVYDKYTKLPDKGLEKIKARYKNIKDREFQFRDYDRYIEQVRSDICCNTEYSLAPGKTPKNKDFVEYFLYENKKGYCCHYAAAATVIFRAMGIPTRYVEGYVIRTNDYDFDSKMGEYIITDSSNYMNNYQNRHLAVIANVKDSNAHAWTEIYVDGYGWIPLEVTKTDDYNKTNIDSIIDSKSQDNNKSNTNNSSDNVKDNNSSINEITNVDDNNDNENNYNDIVSDYKSDTVNDSINKLIIYIFLIISSVIMVLVIRIIFIRIRRKRLFDTYNNKDAVINMSKYFMSIVSFKNNLYNNISYNQFINLISENYKFIDSLEYEEIIKIMYKAKFSNKDISTNEKNKVSKFILNFSNNFYYTLKLYDKIKFRFIKVL